MTPVALVAGQPVTTTDSQLLVAGIQNAGVYTFQLVVTDDLGVSSKPAQFRVQVTALA